MNNETRMIGEYEVLHSIHVGARELVVGLNAENQYMCGYYTDYEIIGSCTDVMIGADYLEVMKIFAERLSRQIEAVEAERKATRIPLAVITAEQCYSIHERGNFIGEIVAIQPDSLRHEYRRCDRQLIYVTGGNGARAEARGRAVFGVNVYTGRSCGRWERSDILGVVRPEHIPSWATERLPVIQREQQIKQRGEAR